MAFVLNSLAEEFGLTPREVRNIVASAPYRYKVFRVRKRNSRGFRTIAQPAKEVKIFQRFIINQVLQELPLHSAAVAYRTGKSIKHNAAQHVQNNYLLKMDFKNFFPSINPNDLRAHINRYLPDTFDEEDLEALKSIIFWKPRTSPSLELCIGGPSSPFISNTILYYFDKEVTEFCEEKEVVYTRYADDLSFSTNQPRILGGIEQLIDNLLREMAYPRLTVNVDKTVHTSKKHFRRVTGLVLSSQGKISLGREKKRKIRAMVHRLSKGQEPEQEIKQVAGYLAFALDVEPDFVENLKQKYGSDLIKRILRSPWN